MTPAELVKRLLADPELRAEYLPSLTATELRALERELDPVVEQALVWCARWSILNPATVIPVSLVNVVQFHNLPTLSILTRVKCSLWVFALDDEIDSGRVPELALPKILEECYLAASDVKAARPRSELARSLHELQQELAVAPSYELVYPLWATSLIRMIDGMMYEHWMQQRFRPLDYEDDLPPLAEYLHYARHSIAITHLWITGLILEADPTLEQVLPALYRLADQCALVIRLANDYSTYEREANEGGVNAIALRVHELIASGAQTEVASAIQVAKDDILATLRSEQQVAARLASRIRTASSIQRRFIRATTVSVDLYVNRDFRVWTAAVKEAVPSTPQGR